jgi:malonate transporter MadL subunit
MIMYGLGILAFSYLSGQWLGETLGHLLGINANVGGVGFAMLILISLKTWFEKKQWTDFEFGIDFWNKMYVPIVIAMSASQNVKVAVSSGILAVLAGLIPTVLLFAFFPALIKYFNKN